MASPPPPSDTSGPAADESELAGPACVMVFNANDPSGAGGLAADIVTVASVGAHALPIVTGTFVRDTAETLSHHGLDEDAVAEQARTILEDVPVRVFKVGFVGGPETISAVAAIAADYPDLPLIAYLPDLSWWDESQAESCLEAMQELLLPQTTVLVGNHATLWRWLLPDWNQQRSPTARDIARAAAESGVQYTLVTGIPLPEQFVDNVLATPQTVLASQKFERFDAAFSGAGDTLSAALAALVAGGSDLVSAVAEALSYLDRCLDGGFRPGMGHVIPDRMFWAQPEPGDEDDSESGPSPDGAQILDLPPHDTKH